MENSGKKLEKVIKLIEDTLKDSPNTTIHNNYKVKNTGGRYREFDVFIESKINGHEINIAIECKDHRSRIPAEKIEAFETKCQRTPGIHKKVFVSTKGFQAEAINVAKHFGIDLRIAQRIDVNQILGWFPVTKLDINLLPGGSAQLFLEVDDSKVDLHRKPLSGILLKNGAEVQLNDYILDFYKFNHLTINNFVLLQWMHIRPEHQNKAFVISIRLTPSDLVYLDNTKGKIKVVGIEASLKFKLEPTIIQPIESITLSDLDGNKKADTLTVNLDGSGSVNLVRTPDNKTTFYIDDPEGNLKHFKLLATYDPKSDTIKSTNSS